MIETVNPERLGLSARRLRRISAWMQDQIDRRRLAGLSVAVHRRGGTAFFDTAGDMDREAGKPVDADTIFRIYSMTKPVTSVAAMMLYERGLFQLDDPLAWYLPEFRDMQVLTGGDAGNPRTRPARRSITIRHLMTHTSGLTYGFMRATAVDALHRRAGVDFGAAEGADLAAMVRRLADLPLLCDPGSEWNYSVSTDVLGRLVEVLSGQSLDGFFREQILEPLDMRDTAFGVPPEKLERLAALYEPEDSPGLGGIGAAAPERAANPPPDRGLKLLEAPGRSRFAAPVGLFSGGGGLTSTMGDYLRFCRMLLGGGELEGVRLLSRKTVAYMSRNHLPGDMASMGQPRFSEMPYEGIGFGLGFSVVLDPAQAQTLGSAGEYAWGGAASTAFWIDPSEDLCVVLMTQLLPSSTYPLRRELRVLTYQALVD
ncbi:MAG TPA: serine hydrolase domain-containing protein [Gammaproteobacteria bacterium]|nr:serine hydrolase domain-containing protein [Gammaproteobacteria bacterium]